MKHFLKLLELSLTVIVDIIKESMSSWLPIPYRVIIIGGGISGLSAAHTLLKYSKVPCHITILEAQSRIGGWLESTRCDNGTVLEHGPRTARSYGAVALQALNILSDLDIDKKIIGISKTAEAAKNRYIYANKKLHLLPSSVASMLRRQEPFSNALISALIKEPFIRKNIFLEDESVHDFFTRRFNEEIAIYLSSALCRGIFGGDSRKLSLRSCFPILYDYERNHGSIIKGGLLSKSTIIEENYLSRMAKEGNWMGWTLKNGMQTLPDVWSKHLKGLGVDIQLNTCCNEIIFQGDYKIKCMTNNGIYEGERLISTIPSCNLHPLINNSHSKLSDLLFSVNYVSMAVINLEYKDITLPVTGFGVLVPTSEPCNVLGITFDSLIIPQHSKSNSTILTVMAGGAWFNDLFGCPDNVDVDGIIELAVKSVADMLGIRKSPVAIVCKIRKNCIPQYELGHEEKVSKIKNYILSNNIPLTIAGNFCGGVGVNDVIVNSRNETLKWLSSNHMY